MRLRSFSIALFVSIATSLLAITAAMADQSQDATFESIASVREQVEGYLYDTFYDKLEDKSETDPNDLTIAVARIDPRLRLRRCGNPLTFELMDNGQLGGNVSVRTRCGETWSIFVQAQVRFSLSVLVARHNLSRGAIVQADDLEQRAVEQRLAGRDYVSNADQAVGKELKRSLQQGHAVRLAMLLEPKVVKRGDAVIVEAKAGNIFVATPGTALSDGKVGQQIRVKNERSQRVVKVEVIGPGRVRVIM